MGLTTPRLGQNEGWSNQESENPHTMKEWDQCITKRRGLHHPMTTR